MDMNFGGKETLYKISLSKKVKREKRSVRQNFGEVYVYLSNKDNKNCIVYKENLEGAEKRKYPQFIKQCVTNREQFESIIHIINSAYVKNPLENGNLVKTICHYTPLIVADLENREETIFYIDDISIVPSTSIKYKFREKRIERSIGGKINHLDNVKNVRLMMNFGKSKRKLSIAEQSYSEKMYDSYTVYYRDRGALKEADVFLINGMYMTKNGRLKLHPTTIRIANLRVRQPGTLLCGDCHVEVIYAKPILP